MPERLKEMLTKVERQTYFTRPQRSTVVGLKTGVEIDKYPFRFLLQFIAFYPTAV